MLLLLTTALSYPAFAVAQGATELQRGIEAYENGDLDAATAAIDQAMDAGGLTRNDFIRVVAHRLLIAQARGENEEVETLALHLVSLDPDALGQALSPQLERIIDEARGRADGVIRIETQHDDADGDLEVRARIRGDLGALVEAVILRARVDGGEWLDGQGGVVVVPEASAADVEIIAQAIGPREIVLAHVGSDEDPARLSESIPTAAVTRDEPQRRRLSGGAIAAIVIATAVAVGGAVTLGVLFGTAESDQSRVGGPVVEF